MSKRFRNCDLNPAYRLPPSLQAWLPEGHGARLVADRVETLAMSAIYAQYAEGDGGGLAAYAPRMRVRRLIYAYSRGVPGSRRIERASCEDVAFRYWAADQHPDHDTIADFRQEPRTHRAQLFLQGLTLCQGAGRVKLGHGALDGTQVKAHASKHKAMS
jgi:transposase